MANPNWTPNTPMTALASIIIDPAGNVQQCTTSGTTGAAVPPFGTTLTEQTLDNTVVWTCVAVLQPVVTLPDLLVGLPPPQFVIDADGLDPNAVLNSMIAEFEDATGRTLYPAQVERLLIDVYAYRESLVRSLIQYVGQQNLLAFANFPNLDWLAQLVGVTRLPPVGAHAKLHFTLVDVQATATLIPNGFVVGTTDGALQFATDVDLVIPAGKPFGEVFATCKTTGVIGNGYPVSPPGITVRLTANVLVQSVQNVTVSSGGSDIESDDALRTRVQLAPNRFTVAGPGPAYRFFALSASPALIDVFVTRPVPGTVNVTLLKGPVTQPAPAGTQGIVDADTIAAVVAALQDVRPLTDTVVVLPIVFTPTVEFPVVTEDDYQVEATVTLEPNADATQVGDALLSTAIAFATRVASKLQVDQVPEEWIAALGSLSGVYRVVMTTPVFHQLAPGHWSNCTSITLHLFAYDGTQLPDLTA